MRALRNQRGWAGLVVLLLALVVLGSLASTVLKQYGLYPGSGARAEAVARVDRLQGFGAGPASVDRGGDAPSPQDAMSRVRRLGDTVRRQAADLDQRVDDASK